MKGDDKHSIAPRIKKPWLFGEPYLVYDITKRGRTVATHSSLTRAVDMTAILNRYDQTGE